MTYPISDRPTHTSNHHNTAPIPKPNHLFRRGLCSHETPRNIDTHHQIAILRSILQRGRFLLNPRRSNQTIQSLICIRDLLDNGIQLFHIPDIDPAV